MNRILLFITTLLISVAVQAAPADWARAYRSSQLTVSNNTQTPLNFPQEVADTTTYHDTSVNSSRMTTNTVGLYLFVVNIYWAPNGTGLRTIQIRRDGTNIIGYCGWPAANVVEPHQCSALWYEVSSGTHYYEAYVYQTSGADLNIQGDDGTLGVAWFAIALVGD